MDRCFFFFGQKMKKIEHFEIKYKNWQKLENVDRKYKIGDDLTFLTKEEEEEEFNFIGFIYIMTSSE